MESAEDVNMDANVVAEEVDEAGPEQDQQQEGNDDDRARTPRNINHVCLSEEDYQETAAKMKIGMNELKSKSLTSSDYTAKLSEDRSKRFEYLLKQTEIFSHFMTSGTQEKDAQKAKAGRKPKPKPVETPKTEVNDHRHRMTEQEEDEELLSDSRKDLKIIRFDESPSYIKSGEMRDYQVRGLNWMISLYENGINGILGIHIL